MRPALLALSLAGAVALAWCGGASGRIPDRAAPWPIVHWRHSVAVGTPTAGRLVRGVQLPADGADFFTWDPALDRSPSRSWRRFGTNRLVRALLRVVSEFRAAHPGAPRVGIGDLSRPHGGEFGARFGGLGHFSHQNGLDADVYYPRRDGREREPVLPSQIDRALAQDLVNRFVRAGAQLVFVGSRTGLTGPSQIVREAAHHDNHMHVRIAWTETPDRGRVLLGRSVLGRRISAVRRGDPAAERKFLVVGCIHGDECAGAAVVRRLEAVPAPSHLELWLVRDLNPDGRAAGTRTNASGVDLNRNFPAGWRAGPRGPEWGGPRPFSEPEARIARALVRRVHPDVTIWFHQPQGIVRAWGDSSPAARRYARLAGVPFRAIRWPRGTAPRWQNVLLGQTSFVIELPAGPLSATAARAYAGAVLALART